MENKEALNAMEVAELLNITKNTVYELVKRGEIPAYKVGKKLRIDKSDVKEYIDNQKHKKLVSKSKVKKDSRCLPIRWKADSDWYRQQCRA